MVREGFNAWTAFHQRFSEQQKRIKQQDPGLVTWDGVVHFVCEFANAQRVEGFKTQRFSLTNHQIKPHEEDAVVLTFGDGHYYVCGDYTEALVFGPDGRSVKRLGLNLKPVAEKLRQFAFPQTPTGAAQLRWPRGFPLPIRVREPVFGVLVLMRQMLRTDQQAGWVEQGTSLHCFTVDTSGHASLLQGEGKKALLRGIFQATVRVKSEEAKTLVQAMRQNEERLAEELKRPTEDELASKIRYAVTPLFAAIIAAS